MLSRFHLIPERYGRTDRRTYLLYQYRASVCWRAIKKLLLFTICKAHCKVTHIKQQKYFHHLKGRGYNKNSVLYPGRLRWLKYFCCFICVTLLWALHIVIKQWFFTFITNRDLHTSYSTVSFRMTLSDLEWLSKIFDDMKHRAASLRQQGYLFCTRVA